MSSVPSSLALSKARHRLQEASNRAKAIDLLPVDCPACAEIIRVVKAPRSQRAEKLLGKWEDIVEDSCEYHSRIFPPDPKLSSQEVYVRKPRNQNTVFFQPDPYGADSRSQLEATWEGFDLAYNPGLFEEPELRVQPRIVDPHWIDIALLRRWLADCSRTHALCQIPKGGAQAFYEAPSLLVDVRQKCLTSSTSDRRYVALSYVWGNVNLFVTTQERLEQLHEPGALEASEIATNLSRTVSEAIALVEALDERFLWVDTLCIVQNADQTPELNAMATIYANACLTIVAAQGANANVGFRGLRDISDQRNAVQRILPLTPLLQLVKPSSKQIWDSSLLKPWSSRAWTFQEEVFSNRVLYFAHDSVRWICGTSHWSEESESSDCLQSYTDEYQIVLQSYKLSQSPLPKFSELEALVNGFNSRDFTYPEDALSAFAGVSTMLSSKFVGGFISGIPELFFDILLLWQPERSEERVRRRYGKRQYLDHVLPSWSWAGWTTGIIWPYTWNYSSSIPGPAPVLSNGLRPFNVVQFYCVDNAGSRVPIKSLWHSYALPSLESEADMPEGWSSRELTELGKSIFQDDYGVKGPKPVCFTHKSDPQMDFWFPIPLCSEMAQVSERPPVAFISCHTSRAYFKLGERLRYMTRIMTLDGHPAGVLYQHDEADIAYVDARTGLLSERPCVEVIALLGCTVPKDDDFLWAASSLSSHDSSRTQEGNVDSGSLDEEPELDRDGDSLDTKEIYNIMWIEWKEGVAYRKATGEIERHIWEKQALEWIGVMLG
ncbi:MAG: hypothetical protein M1822_009203 [Bathelium mastoideum]|nr:MAG: hypothetical protein M1822_009203 [Bathelium mastoideum]